MANDFAAYTFDVTKWVPKYILADKNGYAMAMAIQAGMRYFIDRVKEGVALITDVDTMPEWRLDELAWELNCYYEYNETDIEAKRWWIKNALAISRIAGTPGAVRMYLTKKFDRAWVSEYSYYSAAAGEWPRIPTEPFHFAVVVDGAYNTNMDIESMVSKVQNVRSVFDGAKVGTLDMFGLLTDEYSIVIDGAFIGPEAPIIEGSEGAAS